MGKPNKSKANGRREKSPQGGRTMALHRGVWCFLTAAIAREGTEPAETRRLESGEDIVSPPANGHSDGRADSSAAVPRGEAASGDFATRTPCATPSTADDRLLRHRRCLRPPVAVVGSGVGT